jgi:hypothetical protein
MQYVLTVNIMPVIIAFIAEIHLIICRKEEFLEVFAGRINDSLISLLPQIFSFQN